MKEIKPAKLLEFIELFYDDLVKEKDWDVYLLHLQAGVKDLANFEVWREKARTPKVKTDQQEVLDYVKKVMNFTGKRMAHEKKLEELRLRNLQKGGVKN